MCSIHFVPSFASPSSVSKYLRQASNWYAFFSFLSCITFNVILPILVSRWSWFVFILDKKKSSSPWHVRLLSHISSDMDMKLARNVQRPIRAGG